VTVAGPKDAIHGLTAADFEVRLNDKLVHNVVVDDLCVTPPVVPAVATPDAAAEGSHPAPKTATASYLLYFDMAHVTQSGRQGSIDSAREMLPKLLAVGQRAMIIANAAQLKTIVSFTSDLAQLDKALAALIPDLSTFDPYAAMEQNRLADIATKVGSTDPMSNDGPAAALALARRYAAEERWRQENDLRRLSMVLGRFADLDPPKVVLYFADTMRQNAGEHYLSFFNELDLVVRNGSAKPETEAIRIDAATGVLPLDRVINDAAGLGIRFYTVEGQGITGEASPIEARNSASSGAAGGNQAPPTVNSQHTRDAQGTLVSMAAETGGRAFLNGVVPGRMSAQILNDLSCLYLLSFDPKGFPQDDPLAVAVAVKRPKVTTTVRGRLVIQSDSTRTTGRVLSAFVSPTAGPQATDTRVRVGLIPISYETGKFKARVQVVLAGSAVPATTWDIGASVVSRGAVRQDGSGRIQLMTPNTPVVYEQDLDFAPGDSTSSRSPT
jgi:VWFA-related protein